MYDLDYVEYDASGLLKTKCMRCGTEIAGRYYNSLINAVGEKVTVPQFMQLQNFRRGNAINIKTEQNKLPPIYPLLCDGCVNEPIENEKIIEQVKYGWKKELKAAGRSDAQIKEYMDKFGGIMEEK